MKLFLAVKAGFFSKVRFCQSRFQVTIFPFKFVKRNPPPQNFLLLPFFVFSPFWRFCSLLGPCALFRLLRFCLSVPAKPCSTCAARFQLVVAGPMTLNKSFVHQLFVKWPLAHHRASTARIAPNLDFLCAAWWSLGGPQARMQFCYSRNFEFALCLLLELAHTTSTTHQRENPNA